MSQFALCNSAKKLKHQTLACFSFLVFLKTLRHIGPILGNDTRKRNLRIGMLLKTVTPEVLLVPQIRNDNEAPDQS